MNLHDPITVPTRIQEGYQRWQDVRRASPTVRVVERLETDFRADGEVATLNFRMVDVDIMRQMHLLMRQANLDRRTLLRWEVDRYVWFQLELMDEMVPRVFGLPISASHGPLIRLITNTRTYEYDPR